MNIYRNIITNRLVLVYRCTPRLIIGSYEQTEDFRTGKTEMMTDNGVHSWKNLRLVATR